MANNANIDDIDIITLYTNRKTSELNSEYTMNTIMETTEVRKII